MCLSRRAMASSKPSLCMRDTFKRPVTVHLWAVGWPLAYGGPYLKQVMDMKPGFPSQTGSYVSAAVGVAKGLGLACLQEKLWEFRGAEGRDIIFKVVHWGKLFWEHSTLQGTQDTHEYLKGAKKEEPAHLANTLSKPGSYSFKPNSFSSSLLHSQLLFYLFQKMSSLWLSTKVRETEVVVCPGGVPLSSSFPISASWVVLRLSHTCRCNMFYRTRWSTEFYGNATSSEKNCRYNVGQRLQSSKQSLMTQTFKKEVQYLIPPLCDWETTPFFSLSSLFKKMR